MGPLSERSQYSQQTEKRLSGEAGKGKFLRGGKRLGQNTPSKSSLTTKEDDVLRTFSFQDGIFLRQWLTHGHSAYCYL